MSEMGSRTMEHRHGEHSTILILVRAATIATEIADDDGVVVPRAMPSPLLADVHRPSTPANIPC